MRVVLACPTIRERAHRLAQFEELWRSRTHDAKLDIRYSEAGDTWSAGLNDVWQQVRHRPPDVFILGSDDMVPADERWLPTASHWLDQGKVPGPRVEDPRFVNTAGHPGTVAEGTPGDMTAFLIIKGAWAKHVFPLPDDLAYFADNLACVLLTRAGYEIVAVPSCRIIHLHAPEGRGFGYGSENTRLFIDTVRYSRALDERGIDRLSLPVGQRGGMWEDHFHEIGTLAGA